MPKAYSYIRFSSVRQQRGDSVARQTRLSAEYAAKHNLDLDTELNLSDLGISAFDRSNLEKGALGQFLRLVEEGRIPKGSFLLVESLDRLSRDKVMDALAIFSSILKAGITIVTLSDGQVYSYEKVNENWSSLIVSIGIMSRANEESAMKSRRIRSSWDAKRKNIANKRLTKRCPYWLKPTADDCGFEFIPERVEVVRRIFKMSMDGVGGATIVKMFNNEGVPVFSTKSNGWQNSYIEKVLNSVSVYGALRLKLQRDGEETELEEIPGYYPAIMSKEEWLLVAAARKSRRTRGGVSKGNQLSNLFSGLLRCGYCGGPMNMGGNAKKRGSGVPKVRKYVACSNARRGLGCKYLQWEYSDFEQLVLRFCKTVDLSQVLGVDRRGENELNAEMQRHERIKQEIVGVNNRNQSLLDALEAGGLAEPPQSILDRVRANELKLSSLKDEQRQSAEEILRLTNSRVDASIQQSLIVTLLQQLETLEGDDLHLLRIRLSEAIKRVIKRISTYPGGRWYSEDEIETYRRDLIASEEFDGETIKAMCAKLDAQPNKNNRMLMLEFHNGEHRTVLSSGKVLDQKTPPPAVWDISALFESLAFKVFKSAEA
jgi:DNA invertase Pin-like site-specific DNA recombinase